MYFNDRILYTVFSLSKSWSAHKIFRIYRVKTLDKIMALSDVIQYSASLFLSTDRIVGACPLATLS